MALRQLRYWGDEILHKYSREVNKVDTHILTLLDDMAETMYNTNNGAGLAACQVGVLKRLVVIDMGSGLIKLINPILVGTSGFQECVESCLSFPNLFAKVIRPQKVTVQAIDVHGKSILVTGKNEMAKCLCHELDHLDGIVLPDRMVERIKI